MYDYRPQFEVMYGQELSQEELRAARTADKTMGFLVGFEHEDGTLSQHWSVGWKVERNGSTDITDEWHASDSWTARKIIRPSYELNTTVKLVLRISGKRRKGKLRANRWTATLSMGGYGGLGCSIRGSCRSLADALRRAEKLDLTEAINELRRRFYAREGAECVYRKDKDGSFYPWVTHLGGGHEIMKWPIGEYLINNRMGASTVERGYWGYSGTSGGKESAELSKLYPNWVGE